MTVMDKQCVINMLYRLGYHFYGYCNGTIRFFRSHTEAEMYVRNMKYLSAQMDQNIPENAFYTRQYTDTDAPELYGSQVKIILS